MYVRKYPLCAYFPLGRRSERLGRRLVSLQKQRPSDYCIRLLWKNGKANVLSASDRQKLTRSISAAHGSNRLSKKPLLDPGC